MRGLNEEQRRMLIDKLPDAAHAAMAALVFGQFVTEGPVSPFLAAWGFAFWSTLLLCAMVLAQESEE